MGRRKADLIEMENNLKKQQEDMARQIAEFQRMNLSDLNQDEATDSEEDLYI